MDGVGEQDDVGVGARVHPEGGAGVAGVAEAADGKDDAARTGEGGVDIPTERAHVVAEGAAGCAIAAAMGGRAGQGKVVAVVSGGNIDLSTFASLVL